MSDLVRRGDDASVPAVQSPEQVYRQTTGELERLVWDLLLRPTPPDDQFRVLQLGAVIELMPGVLVQLVRLTYNRPFDRYVRVWFQSDGVDGEPQEVDLLTFYTQDFPDATFTSHRLGMNMNAAWWDVVRQRLLQLRELLEASGELRQQALPAASPDVAFVGPIPADVQRASAVFEPMARVKEILTHDGPLDLGTLFGRRGQPGARTTGAPTASAPAASGTRRLPDAMETRPIPTPDTVAAPPPAAPPRRTGRTGGPITETAPLATPQEVRQLDELRRQTHHLFGEYERLRFEAYAQRDALDRELASDYFTLYPFMREAARHFAEDVMREKVAEWIERGFPLPEGAEMAASGLGERQIAETLSHARTTQRTLDGVQTQIQERTTVLRRLCELLGGHQPRTERDERGVPRTVCERCGAPLSSSAPDPGERWLTT